ENRCSVTERVSAAAIARMRPLSPFVSRPPAKPMHNSLEPQADARSVDPKADPNGLMIGRRYRLEMRIGLGAMGAVYRALDTTTHERVAIKVLHSEFSEQQQYVRRFEREGQAADRVRHPNIVRSLARGRLADGQFFLVLEFVRGQSLKAALANGPFAVSRAVGIARQVARALQAAHSAGVIHRDLK